jgi:hypothetical protein
MNACTTLSTDEIDRLARRRAALRLGWYVHALVYIVINLFLALLAATNDRHWAVFPAFGWGIGLAVHGAVVYLATGGGGLLERLVAQERRRLAAQRDPW